MSESQAYSSVTGGQTILSSQIKGQKMEVKTIFIHRSAGPKKAIASVLTDTDSMDSRVLVLLW